MVSENLQKKKKTPKKITESYLQNAGMYYLQRFAVSSSHFRKIMTRKIDKSCSCHEEQNREDCVRLLDSLIEKFLRTGLLDDDSYARGMVSSFRRRGLSARVIQARLMAKGLTAAEIKPALSEHDNESEEDSEMSAALRFAQRKHLGPYGRDGNNISSEKALGLFARAGFSYETARFVMRCRTNEDLD